MHKSSRNPRAEKDKSASFVELFFDLVFVFSVTQVVALLHGHHSGKLIVEAILVFWLVWWAWTQFTWALNAANTAHTAVQAAVLVATAVTFFMAIAVPEAFHGTALGFALSYAVVRAIGLALYTWVAWGDASQRFAVCRFTFASLLGLATVVAGGVLGGEAQYWCWGLTVALDVLAAMLAAGAEGWRLLPEHFSERHGLFVIIALGESLIVSANGVAHGGWTPGVTIIASLAMLATCGLWWTYFPVARPRLLRALEHREGGERSALARDAYSLMHFVMVLGIVAFAVAFEHMLAAPEHDLDAWAARSLAAGILLFVGGMGVALRRATGKWPVPRLAVAALVAGALLAAVGQAAWLGLALVLAGAAAVSAFEHGASDEPAAAVD